MTSSGPMRRAFDIDVALDRIREAVRPYPKAAMFELRDQGYATVFQQVVACIISIRTRDEVSLPVARALFARVPGAQEVSGLSHSELDELISQSAFHAAKAEQILEIARITLQEHGGTLPCDGDVLRSLPGVGPKCANLALGVACGSQMIAVDIHVHRVTNRWGYIGAQTPERSLAALEAKLPRPLWTELNELLVPFGKHICTGSMPRCQSCPVLDMCRQVGVVAHR
jgi:endonuclease-3